MTRARIERLTGQDVLQLASDVGPAPWQVGAVLRLEPGSDTDLGELSAVLARRLADIHRLRQVVARTPPACGRPIWVPAPDFDPRRHIDVRSCASPGDEPALLDLVASLVVTPLPVGRPPWHVTLVHGLADGGVAVTIVFHHVLADGIGGLAVLAGLVDGTAEPAAEEADHPAPAVGSLCADAWRERATAVRRCGRLPSTIRHAVRELRTGTASAPATSINGPVGAARRLAVVRADLSDLHATAHANDATVNDVVLTAVAGALAALLRHRREAADRMVASVPVSGRHAAGDALGNDVGVLAIELPLRGDRLHRLRTIAAATRAHKTVQRGASAAVLGPVFRGLSALGILRWFVNHQRLVNVYETNVRGPERQLHLGGRRVVDLLPVTALAGNVSLSFAVLSYAGRLSVVLVADRDRHPDLDVLRRGLQHELDTLAG